MQDDKHHRRDYLLMHLVQKTVPHPDIVSEFTRDVLYLNHKKRFLENHSCEDGCTFSLLVVGMATWMFCALMIIIFWSVGLGGPNDTHGGFNYLPLEIGILCGYVMSLIGGIARVRFLSKKKKNNELFEVRMPPPQE